jgi:hypothetical protein
MSIMAYKSIGGNDESLKQVSLVNAWQNNEQTVPKVSHHTNMTF